MQPTLTIALRAARAAAEKLKFQYDQMPGQIAEGMSVQAILEAAVQSASDQLIKAIRKAHPTHNIDIVGKGMDEARTPDAEVMWRVRLIDSTANFLAGYPAFMVTVAFYRHGKMEHIALVNPFTGGEFTATRGRGMQFLEKRTRTSNQKKLQKALVSTYKPDFNTPFFAVLKEQQCDVRLTGSFLTDLTACCGGQTVAFVANQVDELDIEVASLLAQESGALTGDANGRPLSLKSKTLVVANPKLFKLVIQALSA
jgi:myo-inositol-1(or 4)-monophosphatase